MDDQVRKNFFRLSIAIIVLGVLILGQTAIYRHQRHAQDEKFKAKQEAQAAVFQKCIIDVVHDLTTTLNARSKLTDPRAESVQRLIDKSIRANGDQQAGLKAVAEYQKTNDALKKRAAKHPYPEFPSGKCA